MKRKKSFNITAILSKCWSYLCVIAVQARLTLAWLTRNICTITKRAYSFAALVLLIMVCGIVIKDFLSEQIIISPFEVGSRLSDKGLTPEMVQYQLLDHINELRDIGISHEGLPTELRPLRHRVFEDLPSIKVPKTGLSIDNVARLVGDVFGVECSQVTGEVLLVGDEINMVLRVSSVSRNMYISHRVHADSAHWDNLLKGAAIFTLSVQI